MLNTDLETLSLPRSHRYLGLLLGAVLVLLVVFVLVIYNVLSGRSSLLPFFHESSVGKEVADLSTSVVEISDDSSDSLVPVGREVSNGDNSLEHSVVGDSSIAPLCSTLEMNEWHQFQSEDGFFSIQYPLTVEFSTTSMRLPLEFTVASAQGSMNVKVSQVDASGAGTLMGAFWQHYGEDQNVGCEFQELLPTELGNVLGGMQGWRIVRHNSSPDTTQCRNGNTGSVFALSPDRRYFLELQAVGNPHIELFQQILATIRFSMLP